MAEARHVNIDWKSPFLKEGVTLVQWRHYRVGVNQGGNCHAYFLSKKLTTFLVISSTVPPLFFPQKLTTFLLLTVTFFYFTRVSPPGGCHPGHFVPVRPRFSAVLCKFSHNCFHSSVTPLEGVTRGAP